VGWGAVSPAPSFAGRLRFDESNSGFFGGIFQFAVSGGDRQFVAQHQFEVGGIVRGQPIRKREGQQTVWK